MRKLILFAALLLPMALFAGDEIQFGDPHIKLVPAGAKNTGGFVVIKNATGKDVKVVRAEANISAVVELHTHVNEGGVMKMRPVPSFTVPAKGELVLKPGSYHIMFINLKRDLKEGEKIPVTIHLEGGAKNTLEFVVRKITPPAQPAHGH